MNKRVDSEHSRCIKTDYLLIRANNFDGYKEASSATAINPKEPTVPVTDCIYI